VDHDGASHWRLADRCICSSERLGFVQLHPSRFCAQSIVAMISVCLGIYLESREPR